MQNLMNDLTKLFQRDERIFADGKLLKNKLTELALKLDQPLIELLLSDNKAKEHFFIDKTVKKDKVLVFDKDKFISFVNNKEFLPDSFTSFKNKIGLMTNGDYLKEKGDVILAWAYKDCVLEGGQEKEDKKRDEIFYNETLSPDEIDRLFEPKVLTNFKKYDSKGEHKVTEFNANDNLIIKGNNLLALHCLKQKFRGQIKLIYIDPPYNTGNDSFKYNDRFHHSTWLSFMNNRLEIAWELLSTNGSIYIQLDYNEVHYCKVLMDEVFGRDNFRNQIVWRRSQNISSISNIYRRAHDVILFYSKDNETLLKRVYREQDEKYLSQYKYEDTKGKYRHAPLLVSGKRTGETGKAWRGVNPNKLGRNGMHWITKPINLEKMDKVGKIYWSPRGGQPMLKYYLDEASGAQVGDVWDDIGLISPTSYESEGFVSQKPEALIQRIVLASTEKNDIVLDFCGGSGTAGAVCHKMNRRYILIEQMDNQIRIIADRLKKVIKGDPQGISKDVNWNGGGSFVYTELKKWNEEYMTEIQESDTTRKLLNIYEKMQKEAFFRYDVDLSKFEKKEFEKLPLKEQKQVLCECLDKNHLYVNLSEIDDATYKVSAEDKKLNKEFYKTVV